MTSKLQSKVDNQRQAIAQAVYTMRTDNEMSQQALAEKAGVDRKTVNRIENGHYSPSVDTLVRLASVLNAEIADFFK